MAPLWERFIWWLGHEANAPSTLVQAVSAAVSSVVTIILCWVTYRYMTLTREMGITAAKQLQVGVRPIIAVGFEFGGAQNSVGQPIFKDRIHIEIRNSGAVPVVIRRTVVYWEHLPGKEVNGEAPGFRNVVIAAQGKHGETLIMHHQGTAPTVEDFASWSDWVRAEISCADLGALAPITFGYTTAQKLHVVDVD